MTLIPANTELVIFDCDGVLVDSEPLANALMAEFITALGWPMDRAHSMRLFQGKSMRQVHSALCEHLGHEVDDGWIDRFRAASLIALRDVPAVTGAVDLVQRCQAAGLKTCVASQGSHEKMAVTLRAANLWPLFEGRIFSARDVARPKPAPDLFLHAAHVNGVSPERCLVIEDSQTGVRAALAAAMPVLYLSAKKYPAKPGTDKIETVRCLTGIMLSD